MSKTLIFGHKNPDTDTICSALAYADLKIQLGADVEAVRLGEMNSETTFALDYFQVEAPRLVTRVSASASEVILIDHNERQQSADDLADVLVTEVIDHHRIANFETAGPIYCRIEPVGCSATIIKKIYEENNLTIPKKIAGLMLSAIISDSLLFKSPTCTEEDVKAAHELAAITGIDADDYGMKMLKAGADVSTKSIDDLLTLDAKVFTMGDFKTEIAQVNTVDPRDVLKRQTELEDAMNKLITTKNLDLFVFVITDILESDSVVLVLGKQTTAFEQACDQKLENHTARLNGVVSRKKQVVPPLTEVLAKL